ncbi:WD40-repeat-containing domain protein [Mycena alexandri]|uniref:WD40-repeat-containing domain protein n=1 Tax=Mycena alexandri TaxID=1745969 RepID=A0AAD6S6V1_9AGAR|nr:WD40-repeat-containing domain protein [Mycena alexandri]
MTLLQPRHPDIRWSTHRIPAISLNLMDFPRSGSDAHYMSLFVGPETYFEQKLSSAQREYPLRPKFTLQYNTSLRIRVQRRRFRWMWNAIAEEADLSYQQASRKFAQTSLAGAVRRSTDLPKITANLICLDGNVKGAENVLIGLHEAEDLAQRKQRLVGNLGESKGLFEKVMRYIGAASEASNMHGKRAIRTHSTTAPPHRKGRFHSLQPAISGHTDAMTSVSFPPSGRYVMSASNDGELRFWDPVSKKESKKPTKTNQGPITPLTFLDEDNFVTGAKDGSHLPLKWSRRSRQRPLHPIPGDDPVTSIAGSGTRIIKGMLDGTMRIKDLADDSVHTWHAHNDTAVTSVEVNGPPRLETGLSEFGLSTRVASY